ncbi:MAG: ACP S-malonyltransferase [Proteobacteria bacterium]|nr:ACP S-malonyltransferase [Pseudomonadota bacterium]
MGRAAFLFPGQGSQAVGMGGDFHEAYDWAREIFAMADEVTGKPITRLCFEGPLDELTRTVNLQPALTAVNLVCYRALVEQGLRPDVTAGHSLGEYAALAAAGVIDPADALRLVNRRGELMQRDADRRPGAMQAIMGLDRSEVEAIAEAARERGVVVVANHNSPRQVVITGESEAVAEAAGLVKAKGGKAIPLAVSGAWHSPLMEDAAQEFAAELDAVEFRAPSTRIVLNVTAGEETDPAVLRAIMARQIISPVRWCETIERMLGGGIVDFVEVGPKKVLAGLVKKTASDGAKFNIYNVENMAGLNQAVEKLGS